MRYKIYILKRMEEMKLNKYGVSYLEISYEQELFDQCGQRRALKMLNYIILKKQYDNQISVIGYDEKTNSDYPIFLYTGKRDKDKYLAFKRREEMKNEKEFEDLYSLYKNVWDCFTPEILVRLNEALKKQGKVDFLDIDTFKTAIGRKDEVEEIDDKTINTRKEQFIRLMALIEVAERMNIAREICRTIPPKEIGSSRARQLNRPFYKRTTHK